MSAVMIELTEEQAQALQAEADRRRLLIDSVGLTLEGLKEAAVRWRLAHETRWLQDWRQYQGDSSTLTPTKEYSSNEEYRQTRDNITRPKVLLVASRLGDMLFPTSEANYSIVPGPVPSLPPGLVPDTDERGQPLPPEQVKAAALQLATERAQGMEQAVTDQLGECNYSGEGRAALMDAALYGTGVIRGPYVKSVSYRNYHASTGRFEMEVVEEKKPAARHVDLWNFFPQPCRSIQEAEHCFELHLLPKKSVARLAKQPGFDPAQLAKLLQQPAAHGALINGALMDKAQSPDLLVNRYAVWEYTGPVPKDSLAAFLAGLSEQGRIPDEHLHAVQAELDANPLLEVDCEVWFCQGVVIKARLRDSEADGLGYHVFNYEPDPESLFGYGVAYMLRDDDKAAQQLWHAIMLNSLMSSGPQVSVRKGALIPMGPGNGAFDLSCTKPRVWAMGEDVSDIRQAFGVFQIPNITGQLLPVYERIKANADEHTMMPLVAQGDPTQAVPTSSGLAMLMNASNVVMRRPAKAWDDNITLPLVSGFVDWNMEFNPDESIKGAYDVQPKGASHLLVKDIQAQHFMFAMEMFSNNPNLVNFMKPEEWAKYALTILEIPNKQLLRSPEEVAQMQEQQQRAAPDPRAEAAAMTAQARQLEAQTRAQKVSGDQQFQNQDRSLDHEERMAELQTRQTIAHMQLVAKLAELDQADRQHVQELAAKIEAQGKQDASDQFKAGLKARLDAEGIAQSQRKLDAQLRFERPFRTD